MRGRERGAMCSSLPPTNRQKDNELPAGCRSVGVPGTKEPRSIEQDDDTAERKRLQRASQEVGEHHVTESWGGAGPGPAARQPVETQLPCSAVSHTYVPALWAVRPRTFCYRSSQFVREEEEGGPSTGGGMDAAAEVPRAPRVTEGPAQVQIPPVLVCSD